MNNIRLGLFQESSDQFAVALHSDAEPDRLYWRFSAHGLCAAVVEGPEGSVSVELVAVPDEVAQVRNLVRDARSRDPDSVITGGVMALDSFSDSWNLTVLKDSAPGYHVALAFSFYPLRGSLGKGNLVQVGYEESATRDAGAAWAMLHPALAAQASAIFFPDAPTVADGCARLADCPGIVDYLVGMGHTFSLADIEQLARAHQVSSSVVIAAATGLEGEDRSWMYRVKLSEHAIANAGLLAVSYARAKTRHIAGLHRRPPREGLGEQQFQLREVQIGRFAHHLALLELCAEYGIGLWSRPVSGDADRWYVAVKARVS